MNNDDNKQPVCDVEGVARGNSGGAGVDQESTAVQVCCCCGFEQATGPHTAAGIKRDSSGAQVWTCDWCRVGMPVKGDLGAPYGMNREARRARQAFNDRAAGKRRFGARA